MKKQITKLALCTSLMFAGAASANCDLSNVEAKGELSLLSNSYAVLKYFSDKMEECETDSLTVTNKLVSGSAVRDQARITLSSRRGASPYDLIQVSASSFHEFQAKEQLQPITDLVKKYWQEYDLQDIPSEVWDLATVDGEIYAVPLQMNMQQFFYRADILTKHGLAVPKTYEDVIANAAKLQQAGIKYPISQSLSKGWNIATEFANIYLSLGGEFFDEDGKPLFDNDKGVQSVKILKSLLPYMSPNALSMSNDLVMVNFQQDKAVMGNVWATRAAEMDNAEVSKVVGKVQYAPAPTANASTSVPATSIFWDGYVLPKRVKEDRELIFKVLMEMLKKDNMQGASALAFLTRTSASHVEGEQYRYLDAMRAMVAQGAKAFPTEPYYSLAHNEIGSKLPQLLKGDEDIKSALQSAAKAYYKEAQAQGFLE